MASTRTEAMSTKARLTIRVRRSSPSITCAP
jgi:hypothetical protein